jgi:molybdopterin converting factor small subunit
MRPTTRSSNFRPFTWREHPFWGTNVDATFARTGASASNNIRALYFAQAREIARVKSDVFALSSPVSFEKFLSRVIESHPRLASIRKNLHFIVHGVEGTESLFITLELSDGDEVAILVPVVGG